MIKKEKKCVVCNDQNKFEKKKINKYLPHETTPTSSYSLSSRWAINGPPESPYRINQTIHNIQKSLINKCDITWHESFFPTPG